MKESYTSVGFKINSTLVVVIVKLVSHIEVEFPLSHFALVSL